MNYVHALPNGLKGVYAFPAAVRASVGLEAPLTCKLPGAVPTPMLECFNRWLKWTHGARYWRMLLFGNRRLCTYTVDLFPLVCRSSFLFPLVCRSSIPLNPFPLVLADMFPLAQYLQICSHWYSTCRYVPTGTVLADLISNRQQSYWHLNLANSPTGT
jgi:hypothetical protein